MSGLVSWVPTKYISRPVLRHFVFSHKGTHASIRAKIGSVRFWFGLVWFGLVWFGDVCLVIGNHIDAPLKAPLMQP